MLTKCESCGDHLQETDLDPDTQDPYYCGDCGDGPFCETCFEDHECEEDEC